MDYKKTTQGKNPAEGDEQGHGAIERGPGPVHTPLEKGHIYGHDPRFDRDDPLTSGYRGKMKKE